MFSHRHQSRILEKVVRIVKVSKDFLLLKKGIEEAVNYPAYGRVFVIAKLPLYTSLPVTPSVPRFILKRQDLMAKLYRGPCAAHKRRS